MIQLLFFIAIIAFAVLLYFNNSVRNGRNERSNRLAEMQEAFVQRLKKKNHDDKAGKS